MNVPNDIILSEYQYGDDYYVPCRDMLKERVVFMRVTSAAPVSKLKVIYLAGNYSALHTVGTLGNLKDAL